MTDDLPRPDELRQAVSGALRQRRKVLARDLASIFPAGVPVELEPQSWETFAGELIDVVALTVQGGGLESRAGTLYPLEQFTRNGTATRHLFTCLHLAEGMILAALREEPAFEENPAAWGQITELVRRATVSILAALFERVPVVPGPAAIRDPLTTLLIRPVFDLALMQEVARAQRHQHALALIMFDLDHLARINARYGYGVGDRVLERMGILVRRFFRSHDWVARHGEDSIAVLLPETSLDDATDLANRVRATVEQRLAFVDHNTNAPVTVTLSAAAVGNDDLESELDPYQIVLEAERAVRRAKMSGRNRVERMALLPTAVSLLGAASMLDCAPSSIRRLVREGHLIATRKGRHYQIERASLERYRRVHMFEPPPGS
jgi:diguanylate cyclase (GGDEF)-like protein/excisionase family DNA binding protein